MALQIQSSSFPGGLSSTIVQNVTVEPYVVVRRADSTATCSAEDVPEEGTGDSRYSLRFRWYRSVVNRGGSVCWVHGDREATLQCVLCLRAKAEVRKSFHCSTDCLRRHWSLHKELHGANPRFSHNGASPPPDPQLCPLPAGGCRTQWCCAPPLKTWRIGFVPSPKSVFQLQKTCQLGF